MRNYHGRAIDDASHDGVVDSLMDDHLVRDAVDAGCLRRNGHAGVFEGIVGVEDAKKLGRLTEGLAFDAVFTSDLPRAVQTTELAFGNRYKVIREPRLREINDGDMTGKPIRDILKSQTPFIANPYPNGESFKDVGHRIASLLVDLKKDWDGKHVAFVAHQAPQLALDILLKGKTWEEAFAEDWRKTKSWQPGWEYVLE